MLTDIASFLWILFIIVTLMPLFKQKNIVRDRLRKIQQIEIKENRGLSP